MELGRAYGTLEDEERGVYPRGILYEFKNKGVTQFAIRKRMKRKEGQRV